MSGLTDPFGLLSDAAYGAERLGRSLIGQDRIRLAVTGLTRAGKTVFLTSLLANLLAAGRGRRTLNQHKKSFLKNTSTNTTKKNQKKAIANY
jgi:predicted YcjX-like family ATPase